MIGSSVVSRNPNRRHCASLTYVELRICAFPDFRYSYREATEEPTGNPGNSRQAMIETLLSVSQFVGLAAVSLISLTLLAIAIKGDQV